MEDIFDDIDDALDGKPRVEDEDDPKRKRRQRRATGQFRKRTTVEKYEDEREDD